MGSSAKKDSLSQGSFKKSFDNIVNVDFKDKDLTPLMRIIKYENYKSVEKYIRENPLSVNEVNKDGFTPLIFSSINENYNVIKLLVENGADVNIKTKNEFTASVFAIILNQFEITNYLIQHGSDVNWCNEDRITLLMLCIIISKNFDMVKLLIRNGADTNAKDSDGQTALIHAIRYQNFKIANYLIQHGADVNIVNNDGDTALSLLEKSEMAKQHKEFETLLSNLKPKKDTNQNSNQDNSQNNEEYVKYTLQDIEDFLNEANIKYEIYYFFCYGIMDNAVSVLIDDDIYEKNIDKIKELYAKYQDTGSFVLRKSFKEYLG